ncbi:tail fiber protein [Cronobacter phage LPCS28]|uniref:Short tail fibers protein n=1 Tax=Cronobacter phage LPCS28 TaxID=2924885 RepID=A0AAE9K5I4_9CAUD|nr:tail fiber protein [Cronobacter phage LPCS28]UNY47136.1 hypothetical protein EHEKIMEA_00254 [Cronobacter phage LPCS28]
MSSVIQHSGDQAKYTFFNPVGTQWPVNIKNVQDALALIGPWARTDVGIKDASLTVKGIAMIASQQEIDAGTDNSKFVTPAMLKYKVSKPEATETVFGVTRYAINSEAMNVNGNTRAITPKAMHYAFENRTATEARIGTAKIATIAIAQAGVEDTMIMTAKKVKAAIDALVPVQGTATETVKGVVKIATLQETQDGNSREGTAVSPYAFTRTNATEAKYGTIKIANASEMQAGSADNVAVTPKKLLALTATDSRYGLIKLTATPNKGIANLALSANASVVPESRKVHGKPLTSDISFTAGDFNVYTKQESDSKYSTYQIVPAGCMVRAAYSNDITWTVNGRYYHLTAEVDTYFDARDGSAERFVEFDVYVNGINIGRMRCNSYVNKGGSRGHSWKYRTWGHCMLANGRQFNTGDTIRLVRVNGYMDTQNIAKITLSA